MSATVQQLRAAIGEARIACNNEAELQAYLDDMFFRTAIPYEREFALTKRDRVDFLFCNGVAVEVKFKESPASVLRQLKRYSECEAVREIVLIVPRPHVLPATLTGKPVHCIPIWRNLL